MSEPGDKTRRDGERGPLPRTNRPRPDAAQRRGRLAEERGSGPSSRAEERSGAAPSRAAVPSAEPEEELPSSHAITREVAIPPEGVPKPGDEPDGAPKSGDKPEGVPKPGDKTLPFGVPPVSERPAGKKSDTAALMAERPTQLDTSRATPGPMSKAGERLKHVALLLADGTAAEGPGEAGAGTSYVGCVIDGRYRIDGVLGRGGMGVVYRARHEVIDKIVAIKILLPTEDGDVVGRFVNEARAATAIGNAHIVDTVDFGALPDGSTYFVMEYLEGRTLSKTIKAEHFIAAPRAIVVARQIAEAMSAAHRAGIVHRDLKPENIFLTHRDRQEDFVKLLDFGIAKMQHAQNKITRAGTIFGTPHYMSPEQAAGAEVDPRTDVYSLGVILYEMVSGKVPFDAENPMGLLTQHMYTEPVPLSRIESPPQPISAALDAVVLRCLAKKAADRYDSMSDLADDLTRVERGEPPAALADLLARAERMEDHALLEAAQQELRATKSGGWKAWVATLTAGVLVAGATASIYSQRGATEVKAPRHEAVAASAPIATSIGSPAVAAPAKTPVALVFSPIDGEVFRNGQSLGGMPVTIQLSPGETADVEIRREGFYPEKVRIDGSRSVIIVRLNPIPGVQPAVPVPSGEPLEELRRSSARMATWLLNNREAVSPLRGDAGTHAGGAPLAPIPAPPAAPMEVPGTSAPAAAAPPAASASPTAPAPPPKPLDLPAPPTVAPPSEGH